MIKKIPLEPRCFGHFDPMDTECSLEYCDMQSACMALQRETLFKILTDIIVADHSAQHASQKIQTLNKMFVEAAGGMEDTSASIFKDQGNAIQGRFLPLRVFLRTYIKDA